MDDIQAQAPTSSTPPAGENKRFRKLWRIEREARKYEFSNPEKSRQIIDEVLEDIDSYDAAPNTWHTLAMIAGRVNHYEARLIIIQAGLKQWPDDIDLLCEEMQMLSTPTEGYNPQLGEAKWNNLVGFDRKKTGRYWRFWVYGAIYLARVRNDPQQALQFLDEGLTHVSRDSLVDIFRSYRRVLVDSVPLQALDDPESIHKYQAWASATLEERLALGLQLGLENGYVLATELAQLYQERASIEEGVENLNKALSYLEMAERLYTGSQNHPVWDIYVPRVRILTDLRRYGDALKLLRSLPQKVKADPSLETMLQVASLMTGEPVDTDPSKEPPPVEQALSALPLLLDNNGGLLLRVAQQHEEIGAVVMSIAQRLHQHQGEAH